MRFPRGRSVGRTWYRLARSPSLLQVHQFGHTRSGEPTMAAAPPTSSKPGLHQVDEVGEGDVGNVAFARGSRSLAGCTDERG